MATRFVQQAQKQLNPVYQQQESAIKSQIPALQQLYDSLYTGLAGQQATETQNILESSAARGLTRSTIPTDLQTALGQSMLQARGQLGAQQAGELAKIRTQLGDLGLQRAQGVQSLADTLYQRDLKERQFQMERQNAEREYQMKLQLARSGGGGSRGGGGGGRVSDPIQPFISSFASWMKGNKSMASRQQQDAYINSLFNRYGIKDTGARQVVWDSINSQFKRSSDPTKDWTWRR